MTTILLENGRIIDPNVQWTVDPEGFLSKSSNTPLGGWRLTGRAEHVIVGGSLKR